MGCHHDYGFAQAPRGFYAEMVYGSNFEAGTCAVPSWQERQTPGAGGSTGEASGSAFSSKPSMAVTMPDTAPAGAQVRWLCQSLGCYCR
jgi:hypothetical protein